MYRIGQEEITELSKVIFARDLFKVNNGLKESEQVETKLKKIEELECELLNEAFEKAKTLISENKLLVDTIYKELKQKERLSKREVEIIINSFKGVNITSVESQTTN